jgi:hypothetical protein
MVPQTFADQDGFITDSNNQVFHKNHPANLIIVCNACHIAQHSTTAQSSQSTVKTVKKKTTRKYVLE